MKVLYLDLFSGIAGDMTLSALVDLGADPQAMEAELAKLGIGAFKLEFRPKTSQGMRGLHFTLAKPWPVLPDPHEVAPGANPAQKRQFFLRNAGQRHQGHSHPQATSHDHGHGHHFSHVHLDSLLSLIRQAGLSPWVTDHACSLFQRIGAAEAQIHGQTLDKVQLHEVGAVDSLVDMIGVCLALEQLQPDLIFASPVPLGWGFTQCEHGRYPVPAPAALELLKGVPLRESVQAKELTTPTGAAILREFVQEYKSSLPAMQVTKIGYGAGTSELVNQPNILRAIWGEA